MNLLKKLAASVAVRRALVALVLAVLAALGVSVGVGCALPPVPNAPHLAVFECQLAAFEDAVPREAAEDLVMAARANNVRYVVQQLLALGLQPQAIQDLANAFTACSAPVSLEPDPADEDLQLPEIERA